VAFRRAVGVNWRINGAVTSDHLLWELRRARVRATWLERTEMPADEIWRRCEGDAHWSAPDPPAGRWLHGYDINGMYLPAAGTLELPVGKLRHIARDCNPEIAVLPGYWRIAGETGWQTSPTVIYRTVDLGQELRVAEGWTWEHHGRHLRPWYERLRDARTELARWGPPAALAAVKATYTMGIGYLAHAGKGERHSALYQPYWQQATIALARCNLYRKLAKIDAQPAHIWTDAAYYPTDEPNGLRYATQIGVPIGDGLGQMKYLGRYDLDTQIG